MWVGVLFVAENGKVRRRKAAGLPKSRGTRPARRGQCSAFLRSQRFLSVIPTPAPSMSTNEVSRSGLVVIAST